MSAADISALVIALREGVEMSLIVGIVLAYLAQIGARAAQRWVWLGVGTAVVVALGFLGLLNALEQEFAGSVERNEFDFNRTIFKHHRVCQFLRGGNLRFLQRFRSQIDAAGLALLSHMK